MAGIKHTFSNKSFCYEFQHNAPLSVSLHHSTLYIAPFFFCLFLSKTTQNNSLTARLFFSADFCAWHVWQGNIVPMDIPVYSAIIAVNGVGTYGTYTKDKTFSSKEESIHTGVSTPLAIYGVSSL
jgi:hypothetical protein